MSGTSKKANHCCFNKPTDVITPNNSFLKLWLCDTTSKGKIYIAYKNVQPSRNSQQCQRSAEDLNLRFYLNLWGQFVREICIPSVKRNYIIIRLSNFRNILLSVNKFSLIWLSSTLFFKSHSNLKDSENQLKITDCLKHNISWFIEFAMISIFTDQLEHANFPLNKTLRAW